MHFDRLIEAIERRHWPVHGIQVYRDGALYAQWGDTHSRRYPLYSITKSFTSLAIGMGMAEGKIAIHQPLAACLPKAIWDDIRPEQRIIYERLPMERLLRMSVPGYPFRPEGDDWLKSSLNIPLPDWEDAAFHYSNIPAYLCGVAAEYALGEGLGDYLRCRLLQPLGIESPSFQLDPQGRFYGATGMALTVEELSRVGCMLLQGGAFRGKQLIPAPYLAAATGIQTPTREGGYGYFFWKYRTGFSMNGKWGQKCYILPREGLVISFLSHLEEGSDAIRLVMEKELLQDA